MYVCVSVFMPGQTRRTCTLVVCSSASVLLESLKHDALNEIGVVYLQTTTAAATQRSSDTAVTCTSLTSPKTGEAPLHCV